jgi:hypothetical protein
MNIFCPAFLDKICIYRYNEKAHKVNVRAVMTLLKEAGIYLKVENYEFHKEEIKFFGLMVVVNGITMDQKKVQAVEKREVAEKLKEVQALLGFANIYRRS